MNKKNYIIEAEGVTKKYKLSKNNYVEALKKACIKIEKGEMVAIMGPSGSGKSTLMHIMGVLDKPDSGKVFINGRRVDGLKRKEIDQIRRQEIGFIFQGFNLIPTLSALENVSLAAEYAGKSRKEAKLESVKYLEFIGLGDRLKNKPTELSGGQQQRVAITRALINKPIIVLGDEPTGDLDVQTSKEIVLLMKKINKETGTTFVLVTHNPEVAKDCDRVINMIDGSCK